MKLSNRLETIINMVDKGSLVADIGSDHGYVSIELIDRNIASKCFAVENKIGPYTTLVANCLSHGNIITSLSDGLTQVPLEFKTVIIAGMGFETIKNILLDSKDKLDYIEEFIIDSHTLTHELRTFLNELNYSIIDEKCIIEKNIFYEIIKFKKGNSVKLSQEDLKFGPLLRKEKNDDYKLHYENEIKKLESLLKIENINEERRKEINEELELIKRNI